MTKEQNGPLSQWTKWNEIASIYEGSIEAVYPGPLSPDQGKRFNETVYRMESASADDNRSVETIMSEAESIDQKWYAGKEKIVSHFKGFAENVIGEFRPEWEKGLETFIENCRYEAISVWVEAREYRRRMKIAEVIRNLFEATFERKMSPEEEKIHQGEEWPGESGV